MKIAITTFQIVMAKTSTLSDHENVVFISIYKTSEDIRESFRICKMILLFLKINRSLFLIILV